MFISKLEENGSQVNGGKRDMSENTISNPVGVPNEFVNIDQWICWREEERDGKPTKIPVTPGTGAFASSTDPKTWTDFETAFKYNQSAEADGLGFVFSEDDPFVGIDLDDCRDPEMGHVDEDAREIVNRLDSYTEVSPSGTGFHVLIEGELPEGRNRKGTVEMYDSSRFFTMTGDSVDIVSQTVNSRQDALAEVHREYVQQPAMDGKQVSGVGNNAQETPATDVNPADEELIERARNAANGEKFGRLWDGDISSYESQSEADMALCSLLAFWTGGDPMWMDQLFRQSQLIRPKWDEQHFANGDTYGERTIERAISGVSDFYEPSESDVRTEPSKQSSATQSSDGPTRTTQTEADEQSSSRERAYLKEQNKVLTAKLEQQEATIEQQQERIESLEAELAALRSSSGAAEISNEQPPDQHPATSDETDESSVWDRMKRLVEK